MINRCREVDIIGSERVSRLRSWLSQPLVQALLVAILLLAVLLPYWWLAVLWSREVLHTTDQEFAFATITCLLVLVIADLAFLTRYYQVKQRTELAAITRDLRISEDALKLTIKKLNLLSSITRHDIRNHLVAMKIYLELSQINRDDPGKTAEYLAKEEEIAAAIEHQLDFTRQYESLGEASPVYQDLSRCIDFAESGLDLKQVKITVRGNPNVEIFADPLLLKVFFNLFDNSLRHGGKGMNAITITVAEEEKQIRITYEDNGAGIPKDEKIMIFERGHGVNTGFGLFLIREILDITGITIEETGIPGTGARFEIVVPEGAYRFPRKN